MNSEDMRTFYPNHASAARRVEYQNALVLLSDKKISNIQSLVPALELAIAEKRCVYSPIRTSMSHRVLTPIQTPRHCC